jgi:exonuclease III
MPFELSGTKQSGKGSWNGVAILARKHTPVLTCASSPGNPEDHQARYIEAAVQGVLISSIYLPTGIRSLDQNSIAHFLLSPSRRALRRRNFPIA